MTDSTKQYEFILAICHHHANIVCGHKGVYTPAGEALKLYHSCAHIKDDNVVKIRTL